jgi:hypothetical protein
MAKVHDFEVIAACALCAESVLKHLILHKNQIRATLIRLGD